MPLCAHRIGGFVCVTRDAECGPPMCHAATDPHQGPHSNLHPKLPTTCFNDTIVVPLATWIYLAIAVVVIPLVIVRQRKHVVTYKAENGLWDNTSTPKPSLVKKILTVIYYLLIVAMLAMISLVLARMSVADLGLGLLPFTYVGILLALAIHVFLPSTLARGVNVFYWIMLAVAMAIDVATVATEGVGARVGATAQKGYPYSDGITDFSTMIGVEAVLALLEFVK